MCVKLHIEQTQRSKNLRIQSDITERGAVINRKQLGLALKENLAVF